MADRDPYADRQRYLQRVLVAAAVLAGITAATALVLPEDAGRVAGGITVAILVAAPVVRTLWLAVRWARKGDWKYAGAAVAVVAVIGTGALVAA